MFSQAVSRLRLLDRGLVIRAVLAIAIYGASALVVLVSVVALRRSVPAHVLREFLGFVFISSTVGGLEPGTVKAAALQPRGALERAPASYVLASALKGLGAAPLVAVVWIFAEPHLSWGVVAWLPLLCVAGFAVTDLRVLVDLQGRHAAALGLKQGTAAGAHALGALLLVFGLSMPAAIGVSTLLRLVAVGAVAGRLGEGVAAGLRQTWRESRAMLADPRWVEFAAASALGAASGSADRVVGLRYLPATALGAYYLTFEALSRFWVVPYLLAPILFARRVGGPGASRLAAGAWRVTAVLGGGMVAAVALLLVAAPSLVASVVGARLVLPTLALAVAVVLGSFAQLRVAQLQAAGWSRVILIATVATGLVSAASFLFGALRYGAAGLMYAWLFRSAFELVVLLSVGSVDHGPGARSTKTRSPETARACAAQTDPPR
jgi:hypothetical protein